MGHQIQIHGPQQSAQLRGTDRLQDVAVSLAAASNDDYSRRFDVLTRWPQSTGVMQEEDAKCDQVLSEHGLQGYLYQ